MKCNILLFVCLFSVVFATLYEGDLCELAYHEPGKCVRLSQCPSAIRLVRSRQHPRTCSFIRSTPIVCCPLSAGPLNPRLSERKCQIYKMLTTTTTPPPISHSPKNLATHFVIGGTPSLAKEFPHMAALGFTSGDKKLWLCGGTLISEKFVLTAAHCLYSKDHGQLQWARLGDLNLLSTLDDASPEDYPILLRIPHPRFKPPSRYHDIALLELARPVTLSPYIRPACLPTDADIDSSERLVATGWGLTQPGGRQSDFLQKVDLELFTEQECGRTYGDMVNSRKLRDGILHERMFCAGGRSEDKDTCQGDSGGPLQTRFGESTTIVGITSFGKSCGIVNLPGVYTRVAPYVPWIESIVWPDEY